MSVSQAIVMVLGAFFILFAEVAHRQLRRATRNRPQGASPPPG
jgi:hypothetical protein